MRIPLVSVIIPTFNSAHYIKRCLLSLLKQSYKNIQVIVVDGGSSDATLAIIDQFKNQLNSEVYILKPSTQGEARNLALQHARGDFICFCDSDDFYLPAKLEIQINAMQDESIDAAYFDPLHFYSDDRNTFFINRFPAAESMLAQLITHSAINLCSLIIRKNFLDEKSLKFAEGKVGRYADDWDFIFRLASAGARFKKTNKSLAVVEIRDNSHTQWDCQWLMKHHVVELLKAAKKNLDPQYYALIDHSLRRMKLKLVVALLIAEKYALAEETLMSVFSNQERWIKLGFVVLRIFPKKWIRALLIKIWLRYTQSHTNSIELDDSDQLMQLIAV